MLKVLWKKTDAKGYTDVIPLEWLADEGKRPDATHMMIGPRGGRSEARCSVLVAGSVVRLDYGGMHKKQNLEKYGVTIGELKIEFSDETRQNIISVQWRIDGQSKFEDAPVMASISPSYMCEDDEVLGTEGAAFLVSHVRRERKPGLRAMKVESILAQGGVLKCEACAFDFEAAYSSLGRSACEVHHRAPLAMTGSREISLKDLAILCANCHRAIHRTCPLPDVSEFTEKHVRQALRAKHSN